MSSYKIITIFLIFFSFSLRLAFSQDTKDSLTPELIQKSVVKAIKEEEKEKEKQRLQLESELRSKSDLVVKNWISRAKDEKSAQLNQYLHKDWDNFVKVNYPVPYDFYLRGYDYKLSKIDLFKAGSLDAPYQATAEIIEKLYLETYHPSNVIDKQQYFHTATIPIKIKLEYQGNNFLVTNIEYGQVYIERGWQKR
ncbi:MAG: hypothetical protein PHY94_08090 [Candidatus Omnitrophica bacterium]|nr:hypothetical protein [Candidatus Omnitrophota bacterium]